MEVIDGQSKSRGVLHPNLSTFRAEKSHQPPALLACFDCFDAVRGKSAFSRQVLYCTERESARAPQIQRSRLLRKERTDLTTGYWRIPVKLATLCCRHAQSGLRNEREIWPQDNSISDTHILNREKQSRPGDAPTHVAV